MLHQILYNGLRVPSTSRVCSANNFNYFPPRYCTIPLSSLSCLLALIWPCLLTGLVCHVCYILTRYLPSRAFSPSPLSLSLSLSLSPYLSLSPLSTDMCASARSKARPRFGLISGAGRCRTDACPSKGSFNLYYHRMSYKGFVQPILGMSYKGFVQPILRMSYKGFVQPILRMSYKGFVRPHPPLS